jgi:hypothetical protein
MTQWQLGPVFQETTAVLEEIDRRVDAQIELDHDQHVMHAKLYQTR